MGPPRTMIEARLKVEPPRRVADSPRFFQRTPLHLMETPRSLKHSRSLDLERGVLFHLSTHNLVNTENGGLGQGQHSSREVMDNFEELREELDKLAVREALGEDGFHGDSQNFSDLVLYLMQLQKRNKTVIIFLVIVFFFFVRSDLM